MGTAVKKDIRMRVKKYINTADDTTVKMIHAMLKVHHKQADIEDAYDQDINDRRIAEYEQGKIIPLRLTIDELGERVRETYKNRISKND